AKADVMVLAISDKRAREAPVAIDEGGPGRFELRAADPAVTYRVLFHDRRNHLGAVADIAGKPPDKPLTVRLQRCGSARVRFVDAEGKPLAKYPAALWLREGGGPQKTHDSVLRAPLPGGKETLTADAEGRCTLTDLVPGVRYALRAEGAAAR